MVLVGYQYLVIKYCCKYCWSHWWF